MSVVVSQLVAQVSVQGADQAQKNLSSVGAAATKTTETLAAIKPFDAGKMVTDVDVATAKLVQIESKVTEAREKLQTLQNAADAGQAVKGIPEAEANLVILQSKAQQARTSLEEIKNGAADAASGLQQVDTSTQEASEGLQQVDTSGKETTNVLGNLFSKLQETATEMAGSFASSARTSASEVGGGFFSSIQKSIGGLLDMGSKLGTTIFGLQNLGSMAEQVGKFFLGSNADMEQTQVGFTSLLGSSKAAADEMKDLQKFAAETPFQFPELADSTQKLLGFQFSLKDTKPLLTAVGDALSGLGKNTPAYLSQVIDVFGQMHAGATLQTQDIKQLSSVGINGFQLLATEMGKPVGTIRQMVTDGLIPANDGIKMLQDGMEKTFGGGMAAQAKTFNGLLSTFKDNIETAWRSFTGPIFNLAKASLTDMGNLVSSSKFQDFATGAGKDVEKIFEKIGSSVTYVKEVLHSINLADFRDAWHTVSMEVGYVADRFGLLAKKLTAVDGDFDPIAEVIQRIAKSGLDTVTNLLWDFSTAFINVDRAVQDGTGPLASAADILKKFGEIILNMSPDVDIIRALANHSKDLGQWFQSSVVPALHQAEPGFRSLGLALAGLLPVALAVSEIFKGSVTTAVNNFLPVFEKAIPIIIQISGILANGLGVAIKFLTPYVLEAAQAIGRFANDISTRVAPIAMKFFNDLQTNINTFMAIWKAVWPYLAPILKGAWDSIVGLIKIAWALISGIIKIGLDILGGNWKQAWTDLKDMLKGVWDGIKDYLKGAWEIIKGIFTPVGAFFAGVWKNIQAAWGNVGKWFQDRFAEAKNGINAAFGAIGHWFQDRWHDIQNVFAGIGKWFQTQFADAKTSATNAFNPVGEFFQNVWNHITTIFGNIGKWFSDRWHGIIDPLMPVINYVGAVFQTLWNIVVAIATRLVQSIEAKWNQIVFTAKAYWSLLQSTIEQYIRMAEQKIQQILAPIVQWIKERWAEVKYDVSVAWGWISTRISQAWESISSTVSNKIAQVRDTLNSWLNNAKNAVNTAWVWVTSNISGAWNNIYTTVSGKINQVVNFLSQKWNDAKNTVASTWQSISGTISNWWNNIISSVTSKVNTVKNNVLGAFGSVRDGIGGVVKGFANNLIFWLNKAITSVESFINDFGSGLNSVADKLGAQGVVPVAHLPRIPGYATGTPASGHPGGPMIVGERGPELLVAPKGTSVLPADMTKKLLAGILGRVPGYAGGIGDALGDLWNWIGGGARSILDNSLSALGISRLSLPGVLNDLSATIFSKIKDAAVGWIDKILPKFNFGAGAVSVPGNVQSWIAQAMALTGVPASWAGPLASIAMHESGGNPNAQNNTDINAQNGDPSRGLFQTIGSTFATYMLPGHTNILNPVDNAASAVRYILARYGSVFNVPGIISLSQGGSYVGYANGVTNAPGGWSIVGERGPEAMYVPKGASIIPNGGFGSGSLGDSREILARLDRIAALLENGMTIDGQRLSRALLPSLHSTIRNGIGYR